MANNQNEEWANDLFVAEQTRLPIEPLTSRNLNLSIEDAYEIQLINIRKKVELGQKIVGKKIGLTSEAMQNLLGVKQPDFGHLMNAMAIENGGSIDGRQLIQPKIEGEIAFVLEKDLKGPNITILDVLRATRYIIPALEVVDSRIKDWKITLVDTIADNASSSLYILGGKPTPVDKVDLEQLSMALYKNGELINTGVGAAVLSSPANCVAWLANKLSEFGITLRAGEVILSGALSAAIDVNAGDIITARFADIGNVTVSFLD